MSAASALDAGTAGADGAGAGPSGDGAGVAAVPIGAEMADVKAKIAAVEGEIAEVKAKIALYESPDERVAELEGSRDPLTAREKSELRNLTDFLELDAAGRRQQLAGLQQQLAGLQQQLAGLQQQLAGLQHEKNLLLEEKARLDGGAHGGTTYKAFRVEFSAKAEVRAFPFRGVLKLELEARELYPRGTVTRDEKRYVVDFVVQETDLARALRALLDALERIHGDLSAGVEDIERQIKFSSSSFEEWAGRQDWARTYRPSAGSPMKATAPTLVGERLEFDATAVLSEDDFRRIAKERGGKTDADLEVSKRSRTSDSGSVSSGSTRAQLLRKFGRDGPLARQGMVASGTLGLEEAHVGFAVKHFSASIAILKAAARNLGLPGAGADATAAAEKAWWELCATGPRMELERTTHAEYDYLWFYWAWSVVDDVEGHCTIHLARRDIADKAISSSVWPTWCVRLPRGGGSSTKTTFVNALALRKHLTLVLSGADRMLDVATFVQDWSATQSTCWVSGGEPELADHNPLAFADGGEHAQ